MSAFQIYLLAELKYNDCDGENENKDIAKSAIHEVVVTYTNAHKNQTADKIVDAVRFLSKIGSTQPHHRE